MKTRKAVDFHGKNRPVSFTKASFKLAAGKTKKIAVHLGSEKADLIRVEPRLAQSAGDGQRRRRGGQPRSSVKRNLRLAPAKKR